VLYKNPQDFGADMQSCSDSVSPAASSADCWRGRQRRSIKRLKKGKKNVGKEKRCSLFDLTQQNKSALPPSDRPSEEHYTTAFSARLSVQFFHFLHLTL